VKNKTKLEPFSLKRESYTNTMEKMWTIDEPCLREEQMNEATFELFLLPKTDLSPVILMDL
jgi:hypothetical protein